MLFFIILFIVIFDAIWYATASTRKAAKAQEKLAKMQMSEMSKSASASRSGKEAELAALRKRYDSGELTMQEWQKRVREVERR